MDPDVGTTTLHALLDSPPSFVAFESIPRLMQDVVITEKIDGTNAQIHITEGGIVFAGSRNRWLTLESDNFGFARWVNEHLEDVKRLGPGTHYGEWWGSGIQRGYGLKNGEKRFSLFNTGRWASNPDLPSCVSVVPVLDIRSLSTEWLTDIIHQLQTTGSHAAPGFMQPEGIVVYMPKARQLFKYTLDGDGHKGAR
jgi:hypothetical protein